MAIALLTDFGTRDPYVAAMKGVIASRTDAAIVDLTHEVAPFDVFEAAWFLRSVAKYWPAETIFVCVVDPGVGTARRIIAVQSERRVFLAPDNGLLTFIRADLIYSIENKSLFLSEGSSTFHGRDRFAPVAAAIANGLPLEEVGPRIDAMMMLELQPGMVVAIDRFGNVITDITPRREAFALQIGERVVDRMETNYGDAAAGLFMIVGSTGCIEVSMKNASAAEELRAVRGQRVRVRPL
ncbi:MAG TPA: SAM-dependent chlorinase/fluorinase [Thermoanaerobaculia bacterium]|nr:SAM-dependent chlorinase/fluorinase [Thermoanaerobaculia bacterium]